MKGMTSSSHFTKQRLLHISSEASPKLQKLSSLNSCIFSLSGFHWNFSMVLSSASYLHPSPFTFKPVSLILRQQIFMSIALSVLEIFSDSE
ncbi:hypothetical protein YC2023_056780 [Brassica napus]